MKNKQSRRSSRRQSVRSAKSRKIAKTKSKKVIRRSVKKKSRIRHPEPMENSEAFSVMEFEVSMMSSPFSSYYRHVGGIDTSQHIEQVAQEIETRSRAGYTSVPRAFKEDKNKGAIDPAWIDKGVDSDQLEHDRVVESPYRGKIFEKSNPDLTVVPFEFQSCDCEEDEECEICLAQADVEAIPSQLIKEKISLPTVHGIPHFRVRIPATIAESLDLAVV